MIIQLAPMDPETPEGGVFNFVDKLMFFLKSNNIPSKVLGIHYTKNNPEKHYGFEPLLKLKNKRLAAYKYDLALFRKGTKHISENDIIHSHRLEFLLPFLKSKNPKICTVHINFYREVFFRKNIFVATAYVLAERHILKRLDKSNIKRIVFVDENTRQDYIKRFPKIENISEAMPVGVDTNIFTPMKKDKKSLGLKKDDKLVISIGRLVKEKDLSLALEAFKLVEDEKTHFFIIGDGPDRKRLEKISRRLGLKNCRFLGRIDNKKLPKVLSSSDLFLITSLHEGTPTTILEALACGVPVVSTDAGGIKYVIKKGYNGEVIKNRDKILLSKKIKEYLNKDISKNCIDSIRKYSLDSVANRYKKIYEEIKNETPK